MNDILTYIHSLCMIYREELYKYEIRRTIYILVSKLIDSKHSDINLNDNQYITNKLIDFFKYTG